MSPAVLPLLLAALASAAPRPKPAPAPKAAPSLQPAAGTRAAVQAARRWACMYGKNLSQAAWGSLELAVVDPDGFQAPAASGPVRLAYLSVGEADERRAFWTSVATRAFVVEPNPEWPKAHRVDVRSPEWQALLLDRVVPEALAKGYQGFMLDTVDVAEYFESSSPARFAGSVEAAAGLIRKLRARHPTAAILVNNGFAVIDLVADEIDGVVVEDLYTRCLPGDEECRPTERLDDEEKEKRLKSWMGKTGKPVFPILYAHLKQRRARWVRAAARRARELGMRPYLAGPSLERLGVIDPR